MRHMVVATCCFVFVLTTLKAQGQPPWSNEVQTLSSIYRRPVYTVNCQGKYSTGTFDVVGDTRNSSGQEYQMVRLPSGKWVEGANSYFDPHDQKLGGYAHCCVLRYGNPGTEDILYLLTDTRLYRVGDDGDSLTEEFRLPQKGLEFDGGVLRGQRLLATDPLPVTTEKRIVDGHYAFKGIVVLSQGKFRYLAYTGQRHGRLMGTHTLHVAWMSRDTHPETLRSIHGDVLYLESDSHVHTVYRVLLINDALIDLPPEEITVQNNKVVLTTPQIILTPRSD